MYPYYNLALNFNKINLPLQIIKFFRALHFIAHFWIKHGTIIIYYKDIY